MERNMKYIHVAIQDKTFEERNIIVTENGLASIYEWANKKRFGVLNISHQQRKQAIVDYFKLVKSLNGERVVDSGGFSIIQGRVPFEGIDEYVEYYLDFLENEEYDFIFSPDIPWGFEEERLQDKRIIHALNYKVTHKTLQVINRKPEIRDKFLYIYHFKMPGQLEVWNKIHEELELDKHIIHRAIGGLVGVKGKNRKIDFTIFMSMIFRVFWDYYQAGNFVEELRIHLLGVYLPKERFVIAVCEKILNRFAKKQNLKTNITLAYDTMDFAYDSWYSAKETFFWSYAGNQLDRYLYHSVPSNILTHVYGPAISHLQAEITNLNKGNRMGNADAFVPLSIYSQTQLDNFFMSVTDYYKIADVIDTKNIRNPNIVVPRADITQLKDTLQHDFRRFPKLFPDQIESDLLMLAGFSHWLFYDQDLSRLEAANHHHHQEF
jgi:hypothetical protein